MIDFSSLSILPGFVANSGAPADPPPETGKNVGEKWCSFPELGLGRSDRKLVKSQFSIEIFVCKFKSFLKS